jgi:hypothetical protein
MRKLRAEMHRGMLGNGYCARPVELDCHFESICKSCYFFVTTVEFNPPSDANATTPAPKDKSADRSSTDSATDSTNLEQADVTSSLTSITYICRRRLQNLVGPAQLFVLAPEVFHLRPLISRAAARKRFVVQCATEDLT